MKRVRIITLITALITLAAVMGLSNVRIHKDGFDRLRIGYVYVGDESSAYTYNFLRAQEAVEHKFGDRIVSSVKYNVSEQQDEIAFRELIDEGCGLIISTSYGFGETAKKLAAEYPEIEFCQATCANANEEPVLPNYHNFMGRIYEGRYISGVVAGMKLNELIEKGDIRAEDASIGYVGAFPYAEVISGYTSFFLGARSVCPSVTMKVLYTNTWSSFKLEKEAAKRLIDEGCQIISQHSDTAGPAYACEETDKSVIVYHVGYNRSMIDVAPTTHLVSTRINWTPYILSATEAVLKGAAIENKVKAKIYDKDAVSGFERGWVEMLEINSVAAAKGSKEAAEKLIRQFKAKRMDVFRGEYTGTNPFDANDLIDLSKGYIENKSSSAPTFNYVLDDVITVMK